MTQTLQERLTCIQGHCMIHTPEYQCWFEDTIKYLRQLHQDEDTVDREIEVLQDKAILSIIQEEKIKELKDLLTFPTLKSRQVISPKMQSIYKDEHVRRKDIEARITELQKGVEG